jgi:hypothetical protein
MTQPRPIKQPPLAYDSLRSGRALSAPQARYLSAIRQLLADYQRTRGPVQRQVFVKMIHAFMRELCGYPKSSYIVTSAAYDTADVGSNPHVVPASYHANSGLFYFTASESADDVHDLWVKQAQVYLADPRKADVAAESATHVVFTNFFIIDGAGRDPTTGAWHLWSAYDIKGTQVARVDLRILENATKLASTTAQVIQQRLQTLRYQSPPDVQTPDKPRHD